MKTLSATLLTLTVSALAFAGSVQADEALMTKNKCNTCHKVDGKSMGPSFKEVAAKYKGDTAKHVLDAINNGAKGNWGKIPMPAQAQAKGDADALAKWIAGL